MSTITNLYADSLAPSTTPSTASVSPASLQEPRTRPSSASLPQHFGSSTIKNCREDRHPNHPALKDSAAAMKKFFATLSSTSEI